MLMQIYCDESGNTGLDLLNGDQPIFALASTNLDEATCERLIKPFLRQGQTEAKYSKLKGTAQGQRLLLDLFSSPEIADEHVKALALDKTYYIITHIVDKLIEPTLHEGGIDLYQGDAHVGLVNLWYYTAHTIFPHGNWQRILVAFVRAIREHSSESFANFDKVVTIAAQAATEDDRDFAAGLLMARGRLDEFIGVLDTNAFDPANDMFISIINKWMSQHPGSLEVVHDRSKPLKRNEAFLRVMMTPATSQIFGYGKRKAELPLRVSRFEFADSKLHPQIQLADLVAGAVADCLQAWTGRRPATGYHQSMRISRLAGLQIDGLLPSHENILAENPFEPGETNLVDGSLAFINEMMSQGRWPPL